MQQPATRINYTNAVIIIGILFFTFGFVTWVNNTLILFLKIICELKSDVQAFFVTFAFYMAYFFLALPSAKILQKTGFKNGMALGLIVMAVGSLLFVPAAYDRSFGLFLTGLFIQGMGLALLQTAVNPYISIVGPQESAAQRISIMGICNKGAGMLAPLILGAIILKDATALETRIIATQDAVVKEQLLTELANRIVTPYVVITVILILLAFFIRKSKLPEIDTNREEPLDPTAVVRSRTSVFQYRHLVLGILCLFLYVGAEVMAGDAIGIYGKTIGMPLDETKYFGTFTLGAMLVGYIIGVFTIPKYMSQQTALKYSAILGIALSICAYFSGGYAAIVFIALMGLANALMWPAIFPLAISGLGKFTKTASALLIMGIAGGALIPLLYASLKEPSIGLNNELAFFLCMIPCYLYIFYYAVSGYKPK